MAAGDGPVIAFGLVRLPLRFCRPAASGRVAPVAAAGLSDRSWLVRLPVAQPRLP